MIRRIHRFHKKHRQKVYSVTRFSTYLLAFWLLCLIYWINENFGDPSLEQILYHLQFGVNGLVDTDTAIIKSYVLYGLLLPVLLAFMATGLEKFIRYANTYGLSSALGFGNPVLTRSTRKLFRALDWMIGHRAPLYLLIFATGYFGIQFSAVAYIHHQFGKDYFSQHYINPANVTISAKRPKNLVLIYVESLEDTYKDSSLFGRNLLSSLDELGGLSFNTFRQAPGTGWTIAGITATQCGVPLKNVTLYNINDQGENIKSFLPNAVCLGDILSKLGYRNVYMGGDALSFSGKGKFFQDHHYDEIYGREELKGSIVKADMNFWGLYDDDLLQKARFKLKELHRLGGRFNLTITTIDTHGPDGHYSKRCLKQGAKDFPGIVECTSNQVAEFVQFIEQNGYLKDTNIVILGDHLAMSNPVSETLDKTPERHVFNTLISKKTFTKNRDAIVHFDMYPTILEFLGVRIKGDRLGLGYSALSKTVVLPSLEDYEDMEADLLNQSDEYLDLWAKPAVAVE